MTTSTTRFEALVLAMERVILQSTDAEILDAASPGELEQVRAAISVAVEKASQSHQASSDRQSADQRLQQDIRWIRELARNRPKLRPRLAAVFGTKKEPSPDIVRKLARELLRDVARPKPKKGK